MKDLISRQSAIDALREMAIALYGYDVTSVVSCATYKLQNMPSAQQGCEFWDNESNFCALNKPSAELKTGRWILVKPRITPYEYRCSVCGAYHRALYDYCPTCGSDMKGELNNE